MCLWVAFTSGATLASASSAPSVPLRCGDAARLLQDFRLVLLAVLLGSIIVLGGWWRRCGSRPAGRLCSSGGRRAVALAWPTDKRGFCFAGPELQP
jgi:hypothetical protein